MNTESVREVRALIPERLAAMLIRYMEGRQISIDEAMTRMVAYGLAAINTKLIEDNYDGSSEDHRG